MKAQCYASPTGPSYAVALGSAVDGHCFFEPPLGLWPSHLRASINSQIPNKHAAKALYDDGVPSLAAMLATRSQSALARIRLLSINMETGQVTVATVQKRGRYGF